MKNKLNHQCVCAGYAHAFKLLCDRCDIECIYVSGHGGENHGNHGWNIVKVDGKWYHVDVSASSYTPEHHALEIFRGGLNFMQ